MIGGVGAKAMGATADTVSATAMARESRSVTAMLYCAAATASVACASPNAPLSALIVAGCVAWLAAMAKV